MAAPLVGQQAVQTEQEEGCRDKDRGSSVTVTGWKAMYQTKQLPVKVSQRPYSTRINAVGYTLSLLLFLLMEICATMARLLIRTPHSDVRPKGHWTNPKQKKFLSSPLPSRISILLVYYPRQKSSFLCSCRIMFFLVLLLNLFLTQKITSYV